MIHRRDVIQQLAGLTAASFLNRGDAQVTPDIARFRPEIEPIVSLIERTPRERCAEVVVEQLRRGVSYRQLMAALFLAGVRNVNPRPPGFALHCVFVIHSAHLISLEAPPDLRMLPLFYALDQFKASQERDAGGSSDYAMRALGGRLPDPQRAAAQFTAAMDAWDLEAAERCVASLGRARGGPEAIETLWQYGARDYRNIGHKAIFVANASRTLHAIGWQHAEPVLRSLVLGLLDFGKEQQVNGYRFEDQCFAGNVKRVRETFPKLGADWTAERADTEATQGILDVMRQAAPSEACADVASRLAKGQTGAGAVWDAAHLFAAELRMRLRSGGIVGIHAVTSVNALRHAYMASSSPQTRLLATLQGVGWMGQFRKWAEAREEGLRPYSITSIEPKGGDEPLAEVFDGVKSDPDAAAARVFRMAHSMDGRRAFLAAALRSTIAKADEVHYYKYLAALIEDSALVSDEWQPHLYAAMVYYLKSSSDPESGAMKRAREALRGLAA